MFFWDDGKESKDENEEEAHQKLLEEEGNTANTAQVAEAAEHDSFKGVKAEAANSSVEKEAIFGSKRQRVERTA